MESTLLLISENEKDVEFWSRIAKSAKLALRQSTDVSVVERFLSEEKGAVVLWDASSERTRAIEPVLREKATKSRVFAITDVPIKNQPQLFNPPAFAHQLFRRYEAPAQKLYEKLIDHVSNSSLLHLRDLFDEVQGEYSALITNSSQKARILEEIQEFLLAQEVIERLALSGVDAADELIMNAIFDAPWSKEEGHYRRSLQRDAEYDLPENERVNVSAVVGPELVGIRVVDRFGSIDRERIIKKLACDFESEIYEVPKDDPGAGLGIYKITQAAITLLFVVDAGVTTEAIVLIANKKSYREAKLGFCFFSVLDSKAQDAI